MGENFEPPHPIIVDSTVDAKILEWLANEALAEGTRGLRRPASKPAPVKEIKKSAPVEEVKKSAPVSAEYAASSEFLGKSWNEVFSKLDPEHKGYIDKKELRSFESQLPQSEAAALDASTLQVGARHPFRGTSPWDDHSWLYREDVDEHVASLKEYEDLRKKLSKEYPEDSRAMDFVMKHNGSVTVGQLAEIFIDQKASAEDRSTSTYLLKHFDELNCNCKPATSALSSILGLSHPYQPEINTTDTHSSLSLD